MAMYEVYRNPVNSNPGDPLAHEEGDAISIYPEGTKTWPEGHEKNVCKMDLTKAQVDNLKKSNYDVNDEMTRRREYKINQAVSTSMETISPSAIVKKQAVAVEL